jgi:hypothetical protein
MPRQFVLVTLAVVEVCLIVDFEDRYDVDLAIVLVAAVATAGLLLLLTARVFAPRVRRLASRSPIWPPLLTLGGLFLYVVPAVLAAWTDAWAVRVAVTAAAGIVMLLAFVLLVVLLPTGGLGALAFAFRTGRIDPDEAVTYVRSKYEIDETHPDRRVDEVGRPACAAGDFLLPRVGRKKKSVPNAFISEAGNADAPPMFKHFLRVSVEGDRLEITCFGVTGWSHHVGTDDVRLEPVADGVRPRVPVEDFVSISLAPPDTEAEQPASEEAVGT